MSKMDKCINNLKIYAKQVYFEGHINMADDLADIVEYLESLPRESKWIPCSVRLPEYEEEVLTITGNCFSLMTLHEGDDGYEDYLEDNYGFYHYADEIDAWQPLPAPYKEGDT